MRFLPATLAFLAVLLVGAPAASAVDIGAFHADCEFSHRLNDDPIVFFGLPGASHSHDFSGSRTLNAFSTPASIRQGANNCVRTDSASPGADRSAYWVPTLYVDDQIVQETQLGAYYSAGVRDSQQIKPFPQGLKLIAGSAAGGPQEVAGERVWAYLCPGGTLVNGSATVAPTCKTNVLEVVIRFPDCWNGADLDSPDHKSHMAYSRRVNGAELRTCPSTHPRMMPKLQLILRYPTTGGPSLLLASGPINTAHADFMNGWDQAKLAALVSDCLVPDKYCGGGDLPEGHGTHTSTSPATHTSTSPATTTTTRKRTSTCKRTSRRVAGRTKRARQCAKLRRLRQRTAVASRHDH